MTGSRKKKSHKKTRHYRQLREQRNRGAARGEKKRVPANFTIGFFLRRHKGEVLFLLLLAGGIAGVLLLGPDKKAIDERIASISSQIDGRSQDWDDAYPYGYKIITLTESGVIQTSFDTLPQELEINWKKMLITRTQAVHSGNTEEKIKIEIPDIRYGPADISGLTITAVLIRKKNASVILKRFDDLEFVAEIIEDTGGQVYCLLGLRQG